MKKLIFPNDFTKKSHPVIPRAVQFLPTKKQDIFISIVGGGMGLYGDGENTFEIMIDDEVTGWLTNEEINIKLKSINH